MPIDTGMEPRIPLTRERVLRAAIALADQTGIDSLSMRKVGQKLGLDLILDRLERLREPI